MLSQDEPRAWLWGRGPDGAFPEQADILSGREAAIALPGLGLTPALADLYRGHA